MALAPVKRPGRGQPFEPVMAEISGRGVAAPLVKVPGSGSTLSRSRPRLGYPLSLNNDGHKVKIRFWEEEINVFLEWSRSNF
jgi:hypothetical protein